MNNQVKDLKYHNLTADFCLVRSTVLRGPRTGMYQAQVFVSRANNFILTSGFICTSGSPHLIFKNGCTVHVDGECQMVFCRIPVLGNFCHSFHLGAQQHKLTLRDSFSSFLPCGGDLCFPSVLRTAISVTLL